MKILFLYLHMLAQAYPGNHLQTNASNLVGYSVQDFSLKNVDGKMIGLSSYKKAKGFIIVFTCNHCPFAKLYPERLNQLHKKYSALNVPVLAINSMDSLMYEEETFTLMKQRAQDENYVFPYLQDAQQTVGKNFMATHTPQAFVIWKVKNKWVVKYKGIIDDNGTEPENANPILANAVDELLMGNQLAKPEVKAFGCAIYYRN